MKQKFELLFKDEAEIEVFEAYVYYESKLDNLGERFLIEFDKVIKSIELAPNGYQIFHNGTRQIPLDVFPFVVIYKIMENKLIIFAIFQTHQEPSTKIR